MSEIKVGDLVLYVSLSKKNYYSVILYISDIVVL